MNDIAPTTRRQPSKPRIVAITLALLTAIVANFGFSQTLPTRDDAPWITLFDGSSLDNWDRLGDANWRLSDGVVEANQGRGFLITKQSFTEYRLRVEFWVDAAANSGVFIRATDPKNITAANAYEVNIYDRRPDPTYGTGAIVDVAKVAPGITAGGRWNTFEITAVGSRLTVVLNGVTTVAEAHDARNPNGAIALQYGFGLVRFRKVQIQPLEPVASPTTGLLSK